MNAEIIRESLESIIKEQGRGEYMVVVQPPTCFDKWFREGYTTWGVHYFEDESSFWNVFTFLFGHWKVVTEELRAVEVRYSEKYKHGQIVIYGSENEKKLDHLPGMLMQQTQLYFSVRKKESIPCVDTTVEHKTWGNYDDSDDY